MYEYNKMDMMYGKCQLRTRIYIPSMKGNNYPPGLSCLSVIFVCFKPEQPSTMDDLLRDFQMIPSSYR